MTLADPKPARHARRPRAARPTPRPRPSSRPADPAAAAAWRAIDAMLAAYDAAPFAAWPDAPAGSRPPHTPA